MHRLAIRAGALFDGVGPAAVPDSVVLVEDGRIAAVTAGPVPLSAGTPLLELPGATLLPGLVDPHGHLGFDAGPDPVAALAADDDTVLAAMADAARAQLRAGVTTVRDLGDRDYLALRLRDGPSPGPLPTIVAAGPPITTPGGHCHFLGGAASGIDGVRAAVRERAERGVDVIKVMASGGELTPGSRPHDPQFSPAELAALVDEAHLHGLPVTAHAHAVAAIRTVLRAGVDGIEHCTFRTAEGAHAPADVVAAIVSSRTPIGILAGILPGFELPPAVRRQLPRQIVLARRLRAAGALVVVGTDAGAAPPKPHGVLPYGVEQLVTYLGATPVDALRSATSVAAQVCGLGHRKGRVAPGFDADLLAVPGDPLTDIAVLHRPTAVIVNGRRLTDRPAGCGSGKSVVVTDPLAAARP
jgi:imidazolonepropionase-like amidohydrolase